MTILTAQDCLRLYGQPEKESFMTLWDVPSQLEIGVIPKKIYCNRDLIKPLQVAFESLIKTGLVNELKTWDGCFNIRQKRAGTSLSIHAWGLAIDVNAAWNRFGGKPVLSPEFVQCFKDAGFDWGGDWSHPDGMHFQVKRELVDMARK